MFTSDHPVPWKGLLAALGIIVSLALHIAQWSGWIASAAHGVGRAQERLESRVGVVERTLEQRSDFVSRFIRVENEVAGLQRQRTEDHGAVVRELDQIRELLRETRRLVIRASRIDDEG